MFPGHIERIGKRICAKGGGGGGAGQVGYPTYMETIHSTWLTAIDSLITSIGASSPYISATAYDPDTALAASATTLALFNTVVTGFDTEDSWESFFASVESKLLAEDMEIDINEQLEAYKDILDNDLNTNVLPQFRRSMQNVNASAGSAFIIGEALIISDRDRGVAKFQADLKLKQIDLTVKRNEMIVESASKLLEITLGHMDFYKTLTHYTIENNRIKIVAKTDESNTNLEYDVKDAMWPLTPYKEGANMLAAISGGTVQTGSAGPSKAQSAIGGALSGAAAGTMISPGAGTAIGGMLGLASGLIS